MVQNVSKTFGGTQALNNVGMHVGAGEIVALLGENGAGKSTLIKILASVYSLDQGTRDLSRPRRDGFAPPTADLLHPSGPRADRLDDGRREHLPDPRLPASRRHGGLERSAPPRRRGARDRRRRHRPGCAHPEPEPHREIAGGDRTGARRRGGDPRPRRADREPPGRRGRAPLHGAAAAPGARRRHDLCLAPPRRGVRDRRPDGRAPRRARRRRASAERDHAGGDDPADRRARALAGVPPPGAARRRGPACAGRDDGGGRRPGRLLHPRRRGRRARRPARRRPGSDRPRALRTRADHRRTRAARWSAPQGHLAHPVDGRRHQPDLRRPSGRIR